MCVSQSVMSDSVTPWTVAHQAPLSRASSRREYWSGFSLPSPGHLLNPGIEPSSPAWQADSLPSEPPQCLISLISSHLALQFPRDADFNLCPKGQGCTKAKSKPKWCSIILIKLFHLLFCLNRFGELREQDSMQWGWEKEGMVWRETQGSKHGSKSVPNEH